MPTTLPRGRVVVQKWVYIYWEGYSSRYTKNNLFCLTIHSNMSKKLFATDLIKMGCSLDFMVKNKF